MSSFPEARFFVKKYTSIRVKSDNVRSSLWCFGRSCSICWIIGVTGARSSLKVVIGSFLCDKHARQREINLLLYQSGQKLSNEMYKNVEHLFGMLLEAA